MLKKLARGAERLTHSQVLLPLAALVCLLLLGMGELAYTSANTEIARVKSINEARTLLSTVLLRVTDAETAQRGYLLTRRVQYLQPYHRANGDAAAGLARLLRLKSELGDAQAAEQVAQLSKMIHTKFSEMDEVLRLSELGRSGSANELLLSDIGREHMEEIRLSVERMSAVEVARLASGRQQVYQTLLLHRSGIWAVTLISLWLLFKFLRQRDRLERSRLEQQSSLQAERDRLEDVVATRTSELTELMKHFEHAREDERARLARDLHDELGALLTAAKLDVARIRPRLPGDNAELNDRLRHLTETLNSGIALKRRIIETLRPSTLDSLGLKPTLEILCSEFAASAGVSMATDFQAVELTQNAALTVYRLVQESLNNAGKHAAATQIRVSVQAQGDTAVITVSDNGKGFDPANTTTSTHGLRGMRYRVRTEQGTLSVSSQPGRGTTVVARIPLQPIAPNDANVGQDRRPPVMEDDKPEGQTPALRKLAKS